VKWDALSGVHNRSIRKICRYGNEVSKKTDLPRREELEETSSRFDLKYVIGVMNSKNTRKFLRENRRSNIHLYPDDWKKLPIPDVPQEYQQPIIDRVQQILTTKKTNPTADVSALEAEIDQLVYKLYDLTPEEIAIVEESTASGSQVKKTAPQPPAAEKSPRKKTTPDLPPSLPGWD
jgi:adenine-specific DNA-methyltransferase